MAEFIEGSQDVLFTRKEAAQYISTTEDALRVAGCKSHKVKHPLGMKTIPFLQEGQAPFRKKYAVYWKSDLDKYLQWNKQLSWVEKKREDSR